MEEVIEVVGNNGLGLPLQAERSWMTGMESKWIE